MTTVCRRPLVLSALAVAVGACSGGGLEITEARLAAPAGPNAALYFTASDPDGDTLLGAVTDVADRVEIHEVVTAEDGTMGMHRLDSLELTTGQDMILAPGVMHLMLVNADRLVEGDEITVTLKWDRAGDVTIQVPVVAPGDVVR